MYNKLEVNIMMTRTELAKYIDHTLLKPDASIEDIAKLCDEGAKYGFYSVCVNSCYVKFAASKLKASDVKVCSVVGFPLGATSTKGKVEEAVAAIKDGANEVDMVMNIGFLKSGDYFAVKSDIEEVVKAVKGINKEAKVKVILEMCYLNSNEKVTACELAKDGGADFIKTSTGFGTSGAQVEDVILMKKLARDIMQVKAAGGIRDLKTALSMIEAGATRIGTSAGVKIIEELTE